MLTRHHLPVSVSFLSTDLPVWSVVETAGTLYQKDQERFHLLLMEPELGKWNQIQGLSAFPDKTSQSSKLSVQPRRRLLWLEISPYRVMVTMQGNGSSFSYRHYWESGVFGLSRFWLHDETLTSGQLCLRNYTRHLKFHQHPIPQSLRIDYELWSGNSQLGHYLLNVDIGD
ncbi:MAG: hypothetical protein ACKO3I_06940 [Synechococcales cyanobacterium]